jgi:hypothetical protein
MAGKSVLRGVYLRSLKEDARNFIDSLTNGLPYLGGAKIGLPEAELAYIAVRNILRCVEDSEAEGFPGHGR